MRYPFLRSSTPGYNAWRYFQAMCDWQSTLLTWGSAYASIRSCGEMRSVSPGRSAMRDVQFVKPYEGKPPELYTPEFGGAARIIDQLEITTRIFCLEIQDGTD